MVKESQRKSGWTRTTCIVEDPAWVSTHAWECGLQEMAFAVTGSQLAQTLNLAASGP